MGFRPPSNGPDSLHGLARASPATSQGPFVPGTSTNDGFAPGHPLVKDGRRHYGSKKLIRYTHHLKKLFIPSYGLLNKHP